MNWQTEIALEFGRQWLAGHWVPCLGLAIVAFVGGQQLMIWHLLRRTSYLTELCLRKHAEGLNKANEISTSHLKILLRELNPTLLDLVEDYERDFTTKP